jgi:CRISPR type III-A-associated protein Csm2
MPRPDYLSSEVLNTGLKQEHLALLEKWGQYLNERDNKVTTTQIRRFFGEVKRIQAGFALHKADIILLEPKIAYAVGRAKGADKVGIESFYHLMKPLLHAINEDEAKFKVFVRVFEAIVAYHKANEKK